MIGNFSSHWHSVTAGMVANAHTLSSHWHIVTTGVRVVAHMHGVTWV